MSIYVEVFLVIDGVRSSRRGQVQNAAQEVWPFDPDAWFERASESDEGLWHMEARGEDNLVGDWEVFVDNLYEACREANGRDFCFPDDPGQDKEMPFEVDIKNLEEAPVTSYTRGKKRP